MRSDTMEEIWKTVVVDGEEWDNYEVSNFGNVRNIKTGKILKQWKNHPRAKKVICVETGKVFDTVKEAEQWLGKGGITPCCKGKNKTAGKYHWMYYDEYLKKENLN